MNLKAMVEAAQVRAARALIGWSQAKLAETAGVPVSTIKSSRPARPITSQTKRSTKCAPRSRPPASCSFPKDGGGGIGVRLREALEGEYIGWNDLNASNDE